MQDALIIRFWGVRGSYPTPGPQTVRVGGNTSCVEIQAGPHTIILDAGTGIIQLGNELVRRAALYGNQPIVATILFTHTHHDHTQGFPFFAPAYLSSSVLHMFGPGVFENSLAQTLSNAMRPPHVSITLEEMPASKIVDTLQHGDRVLIGPERGFVRVGTLRDGLPPDDDSVQIDVYHSDAHPKSGVHVYRICWRGQTVVYATDTEGYVDIDHRLAQFACDADVLIHDAQYRAEDYADPRHPRQGWGHSTPAMACAVARACRARRLVLFHHEPKYDDQMIAVMEAEAKRVFPQTISAYEGLELCIVDHEVAAPEKVA